MASAMADHAPSRCWMACNIVTMAGRSGAATLEPLDIASARARLGLSLRELGAEVGVSRATVQRWERREASVPDSLELTLRRLLAAGKESPEERVLRMVRQAGAATRSELTVACSDRRERRALSRLLAAERWLRPRCPVGTREAVTICARPSVWQAVRGLPPCRLFRAQNLLARAGAPACPSSSWRRALASRHRHCASGKRRRRQQLESPTLPRRCASRGANSAPLEKRPACPCASLARVPA